MIDIDILALLGIDLFGIKLEIEPPIAADLMGITGKIMGKLNAALAPLSPIFDLIEILILLKEVLDAIATLNPYKILQLIKKFEKLLKRLLRYVPQLSIPRLVKGLLTVLIAFLVGFRAELQAIIDATTKITIAKQKAAVLGSLDLAASIECAEINLNASMTLLSQSAEPLNRLLTSVNFFGSLAGLPEIPGLIIDPAGSAADALKPVDDLIALLTEIRNTIPV